MKPLILFNIYIIGSILFAQVNDRDYERELRHQSKAVRDLKKEIDATRAKLNSEEKREKSASRTITTLEEEISLVNRLINQLKKEEAAARKQIKLLSENIENSKMDLQLLRERYAKRAAHLYKKGSLSDLEKVLSSTSWRKAVYRVKYQKIMANIDYEQKKQIRSLLVKIGQKKLNLEAVLFQRQRLKSDRNKQVKTLRNKRSQKKQELSKIRDSKTVLAQYIEEKEEGVKELENLIKKIRDDKSRSDREERIRRQQEALKTKSFSKLKGQLTWPARGRVISKFGRKWNPELKTTTNNTGIDIKGQPGTPITTVMSGIVTTITFIRGYGNIIIIDHGGSFYTIYGHVTNIQTNVDSEVRNGDIIAYMGDSGSINGAKLHFEIWGKDQKQDPELWLVKQ